MLGRWVVLCLVGCGAAAVPGLGLKIESDDGTPSACRFAYVYSEGELGPEGHRPAEPRRPRIERLLSDGFVAAVPDAVTETGVSEWLSGTVRYTLDRVEHGGDDADLPRVRFRLAVDSRSLFLGTDVVGQPDVLTDAEGGVLITWIERTSFVERSVRLALIRGGQLIRELTLVTDFLWSRFDTNVVPQIPTRLVRLEDFWLIGLTTNNSIRVLRDDGEISLLPGTEGRRVRDLTRTATGFSFLSVSNDYQAVFVHTSLDGRVSTHVIDDTPGQLYPSRLVRAPDGWWAVVQASWQRHHFSTGPDQTHFIHLDPHGVPTGRVNTSHTGGRLVALRAGDDELAGEIHPFACGDYDRRCQERPRPAVRAFRIRPAGPCPGFGGAREICEARRYANPETGRALSRSEALDYEWERVETRPSTGEAAEEENRDLIADIGLAEPSERWRLSWHDGLWSREFDRRGEVKQSGESLVVVFVRDSVYDRLTLDRQTGRTLSSFRVADVGRSCEDREGRLLALLGAESTRVYAIQEGETALLFEREQSWSSCAIERYGDRVVLAGGRNEGLTSIGYTTRLQVQILGTDGVQFASYSPEGQGGYGIRLLPTPTGMSLLWTDFGRWHFTTWSLDEGLRPVGEPHYLDTLNYSPRYALEVDRSGQPFLVWSNWEEHGVIPLCYAERGAPRPRRGSRALGMTVF